MSDAGAAHLDLHPGSGARQAVVFPERAGGERNRLIERFRQNLGLVVDALVVGEGNDTGPEGHVRDHNIFALYSPLDRANRLDVHRLSNRVFSGDLLLLFAST